MTDLKKNKILNIHGDNHSEQALKFVLNAAIFGLDASS